VKFSNTSQLLLCCQNLYNKKRTMVKLLIDRPCTFAPVCSTSFPQDTNMNNIVLIELQGELEKYGADEWKDLYVGRIRFEEVFTITTLNFTRRLKFYTNAIYNLTQGNVMISLGCPNSLRRS